MSEKHILLADADADCAEELRQALGPDFVVKWVPTGLAALAELKKGPWDALVLSLFLPDLAPAQLINRVRNKYPNTVRLVVAAEQDRTRVVQEALGAHQLLIRPFAADGVRARVERALGMDHWIHSERLRTLASRMRTLPTVPALYLEIIAALKSPEVTTEDVGSIIAKDMGITTKLLQVLNSAYFGLPRTVTNPAEAVGLLGFETIKSMVLAVKLLNQYDRIQTGNFDIEGLWQHSTAVAHGARRLVLLQTGERVLAEEAFAAGLLHDIGKAVLAGNFAEQYAGAESLARAQKVPLWEIEKGLFGASHAELGAYLMSLWGLPNDVLEAAAWHHEPSRMAKGFTALTAVHAANVFQHAASSGHDSLAAPKLDAPYLAEIGMLECIPAWCEEILGPEAAKSYLQSEKPKTTNCPPRSELASAVPPASGLQESSVEVSRVQLGLNVSTEAVSLPEVPDANGLLCLQEGGAVCSEAGDLPGLGTGTAEPAVSPDADLLLADSVPLERRNRWLIAATLPALLLVIACFLLGRSSLEHQAILTAKAHPADASPNGGKSVIVESSSVPSEPARTTTVPAIERQFEVPSNAPPLFAPGGRPEALSESSQSPGPHQPLTPETVAFPDLKLQGILFSPKRPAAIIDGILVHPNDRVAEVRIVEIRVNSVILEYRNRRETLYLE